MWGERAKEKRYFSTKDKKAQMWDNRKPESYGGI